MGNRNRPTSRIEAIVIGMCTGLLLLALSRVVDITTALISSNIFPQYLQGILYFTFIPMLMGAIVVTVYIFVKKRVVDQNVNMYSLRTFIEGAVFGAFGAVFWFVVPLFFFLLSQVWLTYAVMIGSVVFNILTEPIWGYVGIDYGSYIGGAIGGMIFCTGIGLFGIGTGRELLGKKPWENKKVLITGGVIAAILGSGYGIIFAYFWINAPFVVD